MAAEHQTWIADIFGDLSPKDVRELMRLLAKPRARRRNGRKPSPVGNGRVDYEAEYNNRARVPEIPC